MTGTPAPGALILAYQNALRGLSTLRRGFGRLDCSVHATCTETTCAINLVVSGLDRDVKAATPPLPWGAPIDWSGPARFPCVPRSDGLDINTAHARLAGIAVFVRITEAARGIAAALRPRAPGLTAHLALDSLYIEFAGRMPISCRLAAGGPPFAEGSRTGASSMMTSGTLRDWGALVRSASAAARCAGTPHTVGVSFGAHHPDHHRRLCLAIRATSADGALRLALRLARAAGRADHSSRASPLLVEDLRGPDGAVPACGLLGGGPFPWGAPWTEPRRRRPRQPSPFHRRLAAAGVSFPRDGFGRASSQ